MASVPEDLQTLLPAEYFHSELVVPADGKRCLHVLRRAQAPELSFGVAETPEQMTGIYVLREAVYRELQLNHLLTEDQDFPSRDPDDGKSHVFYLERRREAIASCRVTALAADPGFLEQLGESASGAGTQSSVIVSRLVIAKGSRGSAIYRLLLANVCGWVIGNTGYLHWYAKCNPRLAKLYARVGAKVIANKEIYSEKYGRLSYAFLVGNIRETSRLTGPLF